MAQFIKSIRIKNFRSIVNEKIKLGDEDLSIFVGRNDAGKSNVLRALNLFFNGETDFGVPFRFDDDFSFMAETGTGKAREVLVELEIQPPGRLKSSKPVKWRKRWRSDNTILDDGERYVDGKPIGPRSGVHKWLQKLKFRYVPAQKGVSYFSSLMSELHDVLNEVHSKEFEQSATQFIEDIQDISEDIATEIENLIGLPSRIQAPSDFRMLFTNLDFGETHDGNTYLLKHRGDGIRAWHVPIILKIMAQKEKEITRSGYVNPDTIWGFEEPENNLEMSNAFLLAEQMHDFSKDIQIVLTTHSPAFYALSQEPKSRSNTYFISKNDDRTTHLAELTLPEIDGEMGILHLITPHVVEAREKMLGLEEEIERLGEITFDSDVVILCEDEIFNLVGVLAGSSGLDDFELDTYNGKDNFQGALQFGRMLMNKNTNIQVIVQRDRDYMSDEEVEELRKKAKTAGCRLFITEGTDIESHFLNPEYITELAELDGIEDFDEVDAMALIGKAEEKVKVKSIDKLSAHLTGEKVSKYMAMYEGDVEKYRHGKTVLKALKQIYHQEYGCRLQIETESATIEVPELFLITI